MTFDTSDLTWYIRVDVDDLSVADLYNLMERICKNHGYTMGFDKDENHLYLEDDRTTFKLWICEVRDSDMAGIMVVLDDYRDRIRVEEMFHETGSRPNKVFEKAFDFFGPQLLDLYHVALVQMACPKDTWEVFKMESGFYDFVKEVYEDDE